MRKVWLTGIERAQYMTATIQATLYNAHFDTGGVPFTPEDLMGTGDRKERKAKVARDHMESMRMNAQLAMQKPGDIEGLPEWVLDLKRNRGLVN